MMDTAFAGGAVGGLGVASGLGRIRSGTIVRNDVPILNETLDSAFGFSGSIKEASSGSLSYSGFFGKADSGALTLDGGNSISFSGAYQAGEGVRPQASAGEASSKSKNIEYTVLRGDSLWTLARKHGLSLRELCRANGIDPNKPERLKIGQKLIIPGSTKPETISPREDMDTVQNPFSTFSLNVGDASFRLASESFRRRQWPAPASLRTEEFVNAITCLDPIMPAPGAAIAFLQQQARDPYGHNRNLLRFSVRTVSTGRTSRQPLNLTILLDISGSMERHDRQKTVSTALETLAEKLHPHDTVNLLGFARTSRLLIPTSSGTEAREAIRQLIGKTQPEGGTNLEAALVAAYEQNRLSARTGSINRIVLLTDGAANLGDANPDRLASIIRQNKREHNITLDCFGIGFDEYNDVMLETLARHAHGRYAYLNDANDARENFAHKLAGALEVAAQNVKVQVEFNPGRVRVWRLLGYEKHRLRKEDFRDNTVEAAQLAAAEDGTAIYGVELRPDGSGELGFFRVRYQDPRTSQYHECEWAIPYDPAVPALAKAPHGMQLVVAAALFSEKLQGVPQAKAIPLKELFQLVCTANAAHASISAAPANYLLQTMLETALAME